MPYVHPENVISPRRSWRLLQVLYDGGDSVLHDGAEGGWSAAEGQWESSSGKWENRLALRWNGTTGAEIGNPQSRGLATWFLVPEELADPLRTAISAMKEKSGGSTS